MPESFSSDVSALKQTLAGNYSTIFSVMLTQPLRNELLLTNVHRQDDIPRILLSLHNGHKITHATILPQATILCFFIS
jgi:hypothetical protein